MEEREGWPEREDSTMFKLDDLDNEPPPSRDDHHHVASSSPLFAAPFPSSSLSLSLSHSPTNGHGGNDSADTRCTSSSSLAFAGAFLVAALFSLSCRLDGDIDPALSALRRQERFKGSPLRNALQSSEVLELLTNVSCIDLMPQSSKVVVLDNDLALTSAFEALIENNIDTAPIWDSQSKEFLDVVNLLDFLAVLLAIIRNATLEASYTGDNSSLPEHVLQKIRKISLKEASEYLSRPEDEMNPDETTSLGVFSLFRMSLNVRMRPNHLVVTDPNSSLSEAIELTLLHWVNSLPIVAQEMDSTVLYLLTPRRLVSFLTAALPDINRLLEEPLELQYPSDALSNLKPKLNTPKLNTPSGLSALTPTTSSEKALPSVVFSPNSMYFAFPDTVLVEVLQMLIVDSVVPIVRRDTHELLYGFTSFDLNRLKLSTKAPASAPDENYAEFANFIAVNFNKPIKEFVNLEKNDTLSKVACSKDASLLGVIQRLLDQRLKAVLITDSQQRPIAKVNLKHVLKFYSESTPSHL